jgi:hypothetical protein
MSASQTAQSKPRPAPLPHAFAYTIEDACLMGGFGRSKAYELIAAKKLKVSRAAGRTLIVGDSLRALITDSAE